MGIRKPREGDLVKQCLQWLQLHGIVAWRMNSGRLPTTYKGKQRLVSFHGMPGLSDVIGILPKGRFLACEIKQPGNSPTLLQKSFLDLVNAAGGLGICVHSLDDLIRALELERAVRHG